MLVGLFVVLLVYFRGLDSSLMMFIVLVGLFIVFVGLRLGQGRRSRAQRHTHKTTPPKAFSLKTHAYLLRDLPTLLRDPLPPQPLRFAMALLALAFLFIVYC